MAIEGPTDVSGLIAAWSGGDQQALAPLMTLVYPTLRRIARQQLDRRGSGQSLESAALANEAYLKLVRTGGLRCESRLHFLALCAQMMRRILVDHARSRGYAKRGGNAVRVMLDQVVAGASARGIEILALERALEALSQLDPRKGRVVELRYFGGLTMDETALVLGISTETAKRDWRMAKTWLFQKLNDNASEGQATR